MFVVSRTHRYHFSASHRLHTSALSEAQNAELYGKCNNPYGHGHDYTLEITIEGPVDETTGLITPQGDLDLLVRDRILPLFSHRNINLDVPHFRNLVASTENIALVMIELLENAWTDYITAPSAFLRRIHIQETGRNGFDVVLPRAVETGQHAHQQKEALLSA